MAVYVDKLKVHEPRDRETERAGRRHGQRWCHMWADLEADLFLMAINIGMKQRWMQESRSGLLHFDLTPTRREKAVKLGAVEMSLKVWLRKQHSISESTHGPE